MSKSPIPENEVERLLSLGNLDLDYTELETHFKDIVAVASKISGMDVSLINLIDPFTQWTIAGHGLNIRSMSREESVCQYTIMGEDSFEVADLSADEKFQNRSYASEPFNLKYYFGVPLTTAKGVNIGALCVLDTQPKKVSAENIEILKILADEVVNKLKTYQKVAELKNELSQSLKKQNKIAQDVREPLAGIIGISDILLEEQCESKEETLEYISLMNQSSKLILTITDAVLVDDLYENESSKEKFNIHILEQKLKQLYQPLAINKNIKLDFISEPHKIYFPIPKSTVLQIFGALISSAINLSPANATLSVELDIHIQPEQSSLTVSIIGSAPQQPINDMKFHKQVMDLTSNMVKSLHGKLDLSGDSDKLFYKLSMPFST